MKGQMAVALVTLRRAKRKPENICEIVYAPYQYSWTIKKPHPQVKDMAAWQAAVEVAQMVWYIKDFTGRATHYHANYVYPDWANGMVQTITIGNHIFYRKP